MIEHLITILCLCGIGSPTSGPYTPAARLNPPTTTTVPAPVTPVFDGTFVNGRCVGLEPLLAWYSPGWDVAHMARIAYRESRCLPDADNAISSATGLLQILAGVHCGWIRAEFGECSETWLRDPENNVRAAASLWDKQGIDAWKATA